MRMVTKTKKGDRTISYLVETDVDSGDDDVMKINHNVVSQNFNITLLPQYFGYKNNAPFRT